MRGHGDQVSYLSYKYSALWASAFHEVPGGHTFGVCNMTTLTDECDLPRVYSVFNDIVNPISILPVHVAQADGTHELRSRLCYLLALRLYVAL